MHCAISSTKIKQVTRENPHVYAYASLDCSFERIACANIYNRVHIEKKKEQANFVLLQTFSSARKHGLQSSAQVGLLTHSGNIW